MSAASDDTETRCDELEAFLRTIIDEGTYIDSGGGFGQADLWPRIGGKEFLVTVKDLGPYEKRKAKDHEQR
jgi:hypothetical protein